MTFADTVTISREEYNQLLDAQQQMADAAQHARVMAEIAAGLPTVSEAELDDYLAAPTPLSFWRKRAGKTQAALAAEVDISQAFLAQLEGNNREASLSVMVRLARTLGVKIEDLLVE